MLIIESLQVELEATKGPEDPTVTSVKADVYVKSSDSADKLQKCLDRTMDSCPVGVLFTKSNIPVEVILHTET